MAILSVVFCLGSFMPMEFIFAENTPSLPMPEVGDTYTVNFLRNITGVVPANLDGDNILDWVGKSSSAAYPTMRLEGRKTDGTFLWEYETGIPTNLIRGGGDGMHEGYIAWDLNGDGLDEVFVVEYLNNIPYLSAVDGRTGHQMSHLELPAGDGLGLSTYPSNPPKMGQHYYGIAYLDGPAQNPSVLVTFGIYKTGVIWAFDLDNDGRTLVHRWTYQHDGSYGTSGHGINTYDLDEDGMEEVIFGGTVLRPDGKKLFSISDLRNQQGHVTQYGHVNTMPAGDLNPSNPGNELFFTVEQPKGYGNLNEGIAVAIMTTWDGKVLWQKPGYQWNAGWCANVLTNKPGDECHGDIETPSANRPQLYSSLGELLWDPQVPVVQWWRRPPEWTGDDVYDINYALYISSYSGYACDIGGGPDHGAEEIINLNPQAYWNGQLVPGVPLDSGWISVKFNKTAGPYPSRWANRHYRQDCARAATGYAPSRDTFRVQPESNNDTAAPAVPQNLTAVAASSAGVDLSWSASTDDVGVGGYRIARCEGTGCTPFFSGYAFNAKTNYSDLNLKPDTRYTYVVAAYDASGKVSAWSEPVSVRIPQTITEKIISAGDSWNYYKGTSTPNASWTGLSFTGSWPDTGATTIGRGSGYTTTLTGTNYTTFYARKNFDIADASAVTNMKLYLGYDDGFVAYINGQEVARSANISGTPTHTTVTGTSHDVAVVETYDLTAYISSLQSGNNVLAIEVHNKDAFVSGDIGIAPELEIASSVPEFAQFDVNNDTKVNITDIQLCIKAILGQATNDRADVNGDGVKNIKDVQAIIKAILGK